MFNGKPDQALTQTNLPLANSNASSNLSGMLNLQQLAANILYVDQAISDLQQQISSWFVTV